MLPYLGLILSILVILVVVRLLLKEVFPQAILLIAGLIMIYFSELVNLKGVAEAKPFNFFEIFQIIENTFSKTNAEVGLMIMAIGGFVAFIDKIGASEAMVKAVLQPLSFFKSKPNLAAVLAIPIGQLLFICVPSAAGLGLLMMASVFPILLGLGVSRLAAVSIITGCTLFGIGPASVITAATTKIAEVPSVPFFIETQIPVSIVLNLVLMVSYYFVNRHYDKTLGQTNENHAQNSKTETPKAPGFYAIIPVLPLVLLLTFSGVFTILPFTIKIETTTAMFFSFFIGMLFELIRTKDVKAVFSSFKIFFEGMGDMFKSVVTLIVAAEVFANGLVAFGFIDSLVLISQNMGVGAMGVGILMTILIFFAAVLMGSGNAAFFAFGPLIPNMAAKFGIKSISILHPMNLSASMGRALSPISGVLIATADVAKVPVMQIVKRNLIPVLSALIVLLIYHFTLCF